MFGRIQGAVVMLCLAGVAAACSSADDGAAPVAAPVVTLSSPAAAIGSPLEMTYRFTVPPDAPAFAEDYWLFVHFLDNNDELMWTDDHQPPTPTRQWQPGSTIEYRRTTFIPKFPYIGEARIEIGMFSQATGDRLPLAGTSAGQRSYRVATFDMRLQSENVFVVFKDGWHDTEVDSPGHEWQWSKRDATLSFRNPQRDVRFYLQVDQPVPAAFTEPQRVELRIGETVTDTFVMAQGGIETRRIDIPAGRLGAAETVDVTVSVDKTFIPAEVPTLKSTDSRELGIRVFRAFVQPL